MADPVDRELLHELLARGVPWRIAREATASTALDRDQTRAVEDDAEVVADELRSLGYRVTPPSWWREDDDGVRIVDRD